MRVSTGDAFGVIFLRLPGGSTLAEYYAALRVSAPLLRDPEWQGAVTGYYLNCARENALRLSYFTREADAPRRLASDFAARNGLELVGVPEAPAVTEVAASYGGEELRFRRFLVTYAPIALDIMLADLLHARRLVAALRFRVTRPRADARAFLEPAFLARSASYRALAPAERARFWRDFAHWPNPPQVDWAHMFVNMVIGFDWPPSEFTTPAPPLEITEINQRLAVRPADETGDLTIPADWLPEPVARAARIRRAESADVDDIAELGARTFAAAFGADNRPEDMRAYLSSSFGRDTIAAELADPAATFLLAEDGGELVGYAVLKRGRAPAALCGARAVEIARLYAATGRTGMGYGSALMAACLDHARREGLRCIWLGVWERNVRAIAFYRRWQFEVIGSQKFVLGSDVQNDLIMSRRLDSNS